MSWGEGIAQGTRVTKRLGLDDEVLAYILQGAIGAAAADLFLAGALWSYYLIGWWAIALFLGVSGLLVSVVLLLVVGRIVGVPEEGAKLYRVAIGNLWAAGVLLGLAYGQEWYAVFRRGVKYLGAALSIAFDWPWYVYAGAAVVLLLLAVKVNWRVALAVALIAALIAVVALPGGDAWARVWKDLKYVVLSFAWPVMAFLLLLTVVMIKEIMWPSLEWTMKPIGLSELREIGLIGLWMPGLFPVPVRPKTTIKVGLDDLLASLEVKADDELD